MPRSRPLPTPLEPGPGQESVWDYPRPPRLSPSDAEVVVEVDGIEIARTTRAIRVLETGHPPVWYIPPADVRLERIVPETGSSFCEWKGIARYSGVRTDAGVRESVAWCYPEPVAGFEPIARFLAFYPGRVARCTVNGVTVQPQAGGFYGGWITPDVVGPFKGEPGTEGW